LSSGWIADLPHAMSETGERDEAVEQAVRTEVQALFRTFRIYPASTPERLPPTSVPLFARRAEGVR